LHDDARAISKVKRRLYELRHPSDYPGTPGEELSALLDRVRDASTPSDYMTRAYGEAKPALLRAFSVHLRELEPVSDEPSLRLLTKLVERQQRHVQELGQPPAGDAEAASTNRIQDVAALEIR